VGERDTLWTVFNPLVKKIVNKNAATWGHLCRLTADAIKRGQIDATFDAVIVDEVQDPGTPEIGPLKALVGGKLKNLMLIGDAGRRIYSGGSREALASGHEAGQETLPRIIERPSRSPRSPRGFDPRVWTIEDLVLVDSLSAKNI
jgi:hypothetical protein